MDLHSRGSGSIFLTHIKWLTYREPSDRCFPLFCRVLKDNKKWVLTLRLYSPRQGSISKQQMTSPSLGILSSYLRI